MRHHSSFCSFKLAVTTVNSRDRREIVQAFAGASSRRVFHLRQILIRGAALQVLDEVKMVGAKQQALQAREVQQGIHDDLAVGVRGGGVWLLGVETAGCGGPQLQIEDLQAGEPAAQVPGQLDAPPQFLDLQVYFCQPFLGNLQ